MSDFRNWYWFVAGDTTQVFSSASGTYVPVTDPNFVSWKAFPTNETSVVNSEAELGELLSSAGPRPVAAGVLAGYLDNQARQVIAQTVFRVLFNHENRIRAIERNLGLNGSPANLTPAQAFAAVRALL